MCKRRWWLRNSVYPNWDSGIYPGQTTKAAILGRVVHKLVEDFISFVRSSSNGKIDKDSLFLLFREFSARARAPKILQEEIKSECDKNPRFSTDAASSTTSIQDCLNDFKRIIRSTPVERFCVKKNQQSKIQSGGKTKTGAEIELKSDRLRIKGVVDGIVDGDILEFKTGLRSDAHIRQVKLYALLYLHQFGSLPNSCKIIYTDSNATDEVPIDPQEIERIEREVASLIADANALCVPAAPSASPSIELCRWCPVRQLCDDYWQSDDTIGLRFVARERDADGSYFPTRRDVQLEVSVENLLNAEGSFVGAFSQADESVTACVAMPSDVACNSEKAKIRILSALIKERNGTLAVSSTASSETFWLFD